MGMLGAKLLPNGDWRFSVFVTGADQVLLELYRRADFSEPLLTVEMVEVGESIYEKVLHGDLLGFAYAFRVERDEQLSPPLLDPYATQIAQEFSWSADGYLSPLSRISSPEPFDWEETTSPRTAFTKSLIYETHVKGMTALLSDNPAPGTFLGMADPKVISHLKELGVTAVELLPIFYHLDERFLFEKNLVNYWGYNPVSFFALHPRFISQESPLSGADQFRTMVREYHRAGIEVLLDVVFNHTGEWDKLGPTVSFRGLSEETYYRVSETGGYVDYTGCGNTVNTNHPVVIDLIVSSLRYWVEEMGVDGFRFDLASALARDKEGRFSADHPLIARISNDEVLSKVKLIAEPWDATMEGYQVGRFPEPWIDWNDRYRDIVRRYLRGDGGLTGEFATRITGSSDLFWRRGPEASLNFVTAHDGFTLRDLVSYQEKHNHVNGHDNTDGTNQNYGLNFGVEGPSSDPALEKLRLQQQKNLLMALFLSAGTPMILGGDEFSRTQLGNNNPYCQDEPWNYINWEDPILVEFISNLTKLRSYLKIDQRVEFFSKDEIGWFTEGGEELELEDWHRAEAQVLVALLRYLPKPVALVFNPTSVEKRVAFAVDGAASCLLASWTGEEPQTIVPRNSVSVFEIG